MTAEEWIEVVQPDLVLAVAHDALVDAGTPAGPTTVGSDAAQVRASLEGSDFGIGGAFGEDGRLEACAGVARERMLKRRHIATVWGVYTTPSARDRGLGRAVVGHALSLARGFASPAVSWVQLSVSERSVSARRVYESLGFVAWGVEPEGLRVDFVPGFDEVHMALRLE